MDTVRKLRKRSDKACKDRSVQDAKKSKQAKGNKLPVGFDVVDRIVLSKTKAVVRRVLSLQPSLSPGFIGSFA